LASLSNLKNVLETAGAYAVLLGLVFVGFELRQNTAAVQAATIQELTHASSDFLVDVGSDPEAHWRSEVSIAPAFRAFLESCDEI
jgi:hypothetical protein